MCLQSHPWLVSSLFTPSLYASFWNSLDFFSLVYNLFSSLGLDKAEWLEDIRKGSCSLKSFLGVAGESTSKFEEGLNSKVKLSLYRTFGKVVVFKKYLRGVSDAGTRL